MYAFPNHCYNKQDSISYILDVGNSHYLQIKILTINKTQLILNHTCFMMNNNIIILFTCQTGNPGNTELEES